MMVDEHILVTLITGEHIIGIVKKKYTDGGLLLDGVKIVMCNEYGAIYLDRFEVFADGDSYSFGPHAIITTSKPAKQLVEFYSNMETNKINHPGPTLFGQSTDSIN